MYVILVVCTEIALLLLDEIINGTPKNVINIGTGVGGQDG